MTSDHPSPAGHAELLQTLRAVTAPLPDARAPGAGEPPPAPDVVVAMPAYNAGAFVGEAIASVLRQEGVSLELVVVDDGSTDNTVEVVRAISDPRVRLIRHGERRGIGASHNTALDQIAAPYVAHVDADDILLPGALAKVVGALAAAPRGGQACAYHYQINEGGGIAPAQFEWQRRFIPRHHGPGLDYRRNLIVHGMVTNPLRIYRRKAFGVVGRFDEQRRFGIDYDMALRIADRFDIVIVPEFLYCQRIHSNNTQVHLRFRGLRFWWDRMRTCRALLRRSGGRLLGRSALAVHGLLAVGLFDALRPWHRSGAAG